MEVEDEETFLLIVGDGDTQPTPVSIKKDYVAIIEDSVSISKDSSIKQYSVSIKEDSESFKDDYVYNKEDSVYIKADSEELKSEQELKYESADETEFIEWHLDDNFDFDVHVERVTSIDEESNEELLVKRENIPKKQVNRKKLTTKLGKKRNDIKKKGKRKNDSKKLKRIDKNKKDTNKQDKKNCIQSKFKIKKETRRRAKIKEKPKEIKVSIYRSYVAKLREANPEMRKDEECLVARLMYTMKNTKPPPPPSDAYKEFLGQYFCLRCDKKAHSQPAILRHYQQIHGTRYLVCLACGKDFTSINTIYKHERRCGAPDAPIVLKARARVLMRRGRGASKKPIYDGHVPGLSHPSHAIPFASRRYECAECDATFAAKHSLVKHEFMHLGLRPFRCDQCVAAYTSKIALTRHIAAKHSEQSFQCDECGRVFKWKVALSSHMNVHLAVKKHSCARCPRRFAGKAALQLHVNREHDKLPPPFACLACPKKCYRMCQLRSHMEKQHGLTVMTPKQFEKKLPTMTDTEVQQALTVYKHESILGI